MADKLLISSGDVIDVQLTSETLVVENQAARGGGRRRRGKPQPLSTGRISNRMRVFLREDGGREANFDFEGARVGVREGHRCAVVRGRCKGVREPVNLMLVNLSTDEHDIFENALVAYLSAKPMFGAFWKACGAFLLMIPFGVFYSQIILDHARAMSLLESFWWALFFAFLTFPVFWGLAGVWDNMTARQRFKDARIALLDDVQARLRPLRAAAP